MPNDSVLEQVKATIARLTAEGPISFADAAKRITSPGGRPLNPATVRRWWLHGARGHRLEAAYFGHAALTSWAAVQRFLQKINGATETEADAAAEAAAREASKAAVLTFGA